MPAYVPQTWENLPNQTTPINATRLAYMETGIEGAAQRDVATDFSAGVTDQGEPLRWSREGPLTPYQFGAVIASGDKPTTSDDNTAAIAAMWAEAQATGREMYLPEGVWVTRGAAHAALPLFTGMTLRGANRSQTQLRLGTSATASMFTWNTAVREVLIEDIRIDVASSAYDMFLPGASGGINGSVFQRVFFHIQQDVRIWNQVNSASFIHNSFIDCEMQRPVGNTKAPFYVVNSAGAANFNLFLNCRVNGQGVTATSFFYFEETSAASYTYDNTFINLLGEVNPGGLIHTKAAFNWTMINCVDWDVSTTYALDIFRFDANGSGVYPRELIFQNCGRRSGSMTGGKFDIFVHASSQAISVTNGNMPQSGSNPVLSLPRGSTVTGVRGLPGQYQGSGSPESVVTAVIGSVYYRTDGGASTSLYVKTSGTGNTGWTAK